jgi:uncharacterized membrane protein
MIVTLKPLGGPSRNAGHSPRHAAPSARRETIAYAVALALVAPLALFSRWWAVQMMLVSILLIVPGAVLLRALRIPGQVVSAFPVYVPCASVVVLFVSGLAVDIAGPLVGVTAPLRAVPLLVGFEVICLTLLFLARNVPPDVAIPWRSLGRPARLGWPFILPLAVATGALRLNSGHGNGIAIMAVAAFVVLLVAGAFLAPRLSEALLRMILYAVGLAWSWSYSLRGDGVYGFDIATEYQRLEQTITTGVWHAAHLNDAYGAMLSVTVMPAELHMLSGVPGLLVLKVIYPAIYGLFPVAIFDLARRVLSRYWAFVAAAFTIGQYAFTEIASLARQEIALVLFVALLAAMLESQVRRRSQWVLVASLGLAMAFSHYSTTYVAITLIGLTLALQWAVSWFRDVPRITGAAGVAFIAVLAGAFIWYVPVTHSDSHLLQVSQTVQAQGLNFLPNRAPGGSLISAYLQGNTKTPMGAAQYQVQIQNYYFANRPFIKPLPNATSPQYALRDLPIPAPSVKSQAGYDVLGLSLLLIEQVANVLAGLGALLMVLRRRTPVIARQIGLMAVVATLLLTLIRFSGTLASAYGQERAQLQGLVLLAITLCWTAQGLAGLRRLRRAFIPALAAVSLAVVLLNTSYLANVVLGGGTPANLTNSGAAFEYFDTTTPELASAQWLGRSVQPGQLVYADEYGQLRVAAMTGIQNGLILDVTPLTLNQHAWVYASRSNVLNGRAFASFNNHLATYTFPSSFLNSSYDLVYTNGSSEVYRR